MFSLFTKKAAPVETNSEKIARGLVKIRREESEWITDPSGRMQKDVFMKNVWVTPEEAEQHKAKLAAQAASNSASNAALKAEVNAKVKAEKDAKVAECRRLIAEVNMSGGRRKSRKTKSRKTKSRKTKSKKETRKRNSKKN
jgi:hypothetical protein